MHRLLGSGLAVIVAMLSLTPAPLAQVRDTAIVVDTTNDELNDGGNDCSLREAIQAANTDSPVDGCPAGEGDDVILLLAGNYVLTLAGADEDANTTGDLDITAGSLILIGPGPERTVIDGNHLDRVLHVHNGATVQIYGIRITQGRTPGGDRSAGGGIYNAGTLLLSYSTVISNTTGSGDVPLVNGGHGGGIYNLGTLTLDHAWVVANVTGTGGGTFPGLGFDDGGDGGYGGGVYNRGLLTLLGSTVGDNRTGNGGTGGIGGRGGWGGGICNSGTLTLTDSTIDSNQTGYGGLGGLAGGRGGLGGGIYSSSTVTISNGVIMSNTCGGGGGGTRSNGAGGRGGDGGGIYNDGTMVVTNNAVLGNIGGQGGGGDIGGGGGDGGGIYNSGALALVNSSIGDNATGDGAYSWWGTNANSGGAGGGIYNSGLLELSRSTISSNTTGSGGGVYYNGGGYGGRGGGIDNSGVLTVTDCTVSGNATGDGSAGSAGGNGAQANSGYGGGVYNSQSLTLRNSTVSYNTAGSVEGDGIGGGIYVQGVLTVTNTILAGNRDVNGPGDCYQKEAVLLSLGYNLVESEGSCVFATTGDLTGTAPLLGPLGDYGGDTLTHPLLIGSPAIDQGSCRDSTTDQRGFTRPIDCTYIANADDGCDIGAFESPFAFRIHLPLIARPMPK